ncbi:hypothetical protein GCM10010106_34950 [Thermopolyspora flexuosa]|nr:hypothetical protein GCM10010106_34950 [Thermopolyspora flexuosa]
METLVSSAAVVADDPSVPTTDPLQARRGPVGPVGTPRRPVRSVAEISVSDPAPTLAPDPVLESRAAPRSVRRGTGAHDRPADEGRDRPHQAVSGRRAAVA